MVNISVQQIVNLTEVGDYGVFLIILDTCGRLWHVTYKYDLESKVWTSESEPMGLPQVENPVVEIDRVTKLRDMEARLNSMEAAIRGALKIQNLWAPSGGDMNERGEMRALAMMRCEFEKLVGEDDG